MLRVSSPLVRFAAGVCGLVVFLLLPAGLGIAMGSHLADHLPLAGSVAIGLVVLGIPAAVAYYLTAVEAHLRQRIGLPLFAGGLFSLFLSASLLLPVGGQFEVLAAVMFVFIASFFQVAVRRSMRRKST